MLKILIVDDEAPTREWIEFCINGSGVACNIIGLASTGYEALALFEEHLPDIVFADIEMPGMNGITLLGQIKEMAPQTHVIILTCHRDFTYARDAMRFDASEYILKTEISKQSITELLRKYHEEIAKRKLRGEPEGDMQFRQSIFLHRLLSGDGQAVTEDLCRENGLQLEDRELFAIALKDILPPNSVQRNHVAVKQHPTIENSTLFVLDRRTYVLLANVGTVPSCLMLMQQIYEYAKDIHRESSFSMGVSKVYRGVAYMLPAIKDALFQLQHEFYNGPGSLNSGFVADDGRSRGQVLALADEITRKIEERDLDTIRLGFQMLFTRLENLRCHDIDFVKAEYSAMLHAATEAFGIGGTEQNARIDAELREMTYLRQLHDYGIGLLEEIKTSSNPAGKRVSGYIRNTLEYISENYYQPITLTELAKQVNLNTDYLSRLFKEEMGCNFVAYLTKVRLEKAAALLTRTDDRVYEIAEAVGYPNISYFSRIFKKHYGVNPFEYRSKHAD